MAKPYIIDENSPFLAPLNYGDLESNQKLQVQALIVAAKQHIEQQLNRKLIKQTHTDELHDGNGETSIWINNPPITSVSSVTITESSFNSDSTETEFTSDKFDLDKPTGEIRFKPGDFSSGCNRTFPSGFQNVNVTYVGGYEETDEYLHPIKLVLAEFVIEMFDPSEAVTNLEKEKLGDYFYSKGTNAFDKLMTRHKKILRGYRVYRINPCPLQ